MTSRPFGVLVVAADRALLRRLSRFLQVFGFEVRQVTTLELAVTAIESCPPDFLLVDGDLTNRAVLKQCLRRPGAARDHSTYAFLIVRDANEEELKEALEAGVDDFLAKPLVYGELLARLRAGARVLEYERRLLQQAVLDPATGLVSRSAFQQRLDAELAQPRDVGRGGTCVLADIDFFAHVARRCGATAAEAVLARVAQTIAEEADDTQLVASFGGGRFCVLLPERTDAEAYAWAERLRQRAGELAIPAGDETLQITLSCGVVGCERSITTGARWLELAEETVRLAKTSGRDCVARCGQFDGESKEWEELATQGKLFESTLARDIMTPCTVLVREGEGAAHAQTLMAQTRLDELPAVDSSGRLVGLVTRDPLPARQSGARLMVRDIMRRDVPRFDDTTSFHELLAYFSETHNPVAVIVRNERPVGLVHCSGLAALSEPLSTTTFSPQRPFTPSSEFLLVPNVTA